MKNRFIRITSWVLAFCLCLTMLPAVALQAEAATPGYTVSSSYKASSYYSALCNVVLTGNQREDIVNVALSQVGYREGSSSNDYSGADDGSYNNYTEYNYWYNKHVSSGMPVGGSNAPWCATFVSWCAEQANIPTSVLKRSTAAGHGASYFNIKFYSGSSTLASSADNDSYFMGYNYTPRKGDLFYTRSWSHVGIVVAVNGSYVITVEGNTNTNGSSQGNGVYRLTSRKIADLYFGVPNYTEVSIKHTVDTSYGTNFTAYPKAEITAENIRDAYHNQIDSTSCIWTSDKCTIQEVYTDGCCKVTYPLDSGGTKTVYSKISLFNIQTNITPKISYWISYDKMGDKITSAKQGDWVYLCYRMYDANSGSNLNDVAPNRDYSVTETIYKPDGTVAHTYTYSKSDNNWIGAGCYTAGTYSYKVEISGEWGGTFTGTFVVQENPKKINVSNNNVNLTLGGQTTSTIKVWSTGYYDGSTTLYFSRSNSNISCSWGDWEDGKAPLTITANAVGTTTLTIGVKDSDSGTVLDTTTVTITVTCSSHNYSYSVTTKPTTSSTGKLTGTCSKCSGTTTITLPKLNTTDYSYTVKTAATCTAAGTGRYTWKTTTYGSFYFDVSISAKGHSYTNKVTAPTCTAQGYTTHTCSCGYSYKDTYTNATGHSYSYKVTKSPTTSATGTLTGTCSKCKGTTTVTLPKLNTTDYSYAVKTAATCTATGTGRYTWKTTAYGSFYFDVAISAKGHSYTNKVTAPTCTAQGYTTHTCSCGYSYKDTYTNATGHSYSYKVTKSPTTSATGTLTGTCSKCKGTTTVTLPKLNTTDYSYAVKTAPTYTSTGVGRYTWKTTAYGSFSFDVTLDKLDAAGQIVVQSGSAAPGETVTVTIALKNNPGIASLKLNVSYGNVLTLTNVSYNTAIGGMSQQPQTMTSPVILNWFNGAADSTGDWTFATLTFVVSETAQAGDTADITVTYNADDVYNIADRNVAFAVVNGTIEVADYVPGDINADGTVNNRDLTRLFQYLSNWNVEVNEPALDVNGDGSINNRDLTRLFQYLSNWNVEIH